MPNPARLPETFLPLTSVVFEILVTLAGGDRHGYSILTEVRERTGQALRPGSLYRRSAVSSMTGSLRSWMNGRIPRLTTNGGGTTG